MTILTEATATINVLLLRRFNDLDNTIFVLASTNQFVDPLEVVDVRVMLQGRGLIKVFRREYTVNLLY